MSWGQGGGCQPRLRLGASLWNILLSPQHSVHSYCPGNRTGKGSEGSLGCRLETAGLVEAAGPRKGLSVSLFPFLPQVPGLTTLRRALLLGHNAECGQARGQVWEPACPGFCGAAMPWVGSRHGCGRGAQGRGGACVRCEASAGCGPQPVAAGTGEPESPARQHSRRHVAGSPRSPCGSLLVVCLSPVWLSGADACGGAGSPGPRAESRAEAHLQRA